MEVGRSIVESAVGQGSVDPGALAGEASATWLGANGVSRAQLAAAIERAIGPRTPVAAAPVGLTIDNRTYQLNMAPGAQISGSQVNIGGTQINIRADTDKRGVLAGIGALVRAGLEGDWNTEALVDLADAVSDRDDISYEDVEAVVMEVAEDAKEHLDEGRIRRMMQSIAEQTISGALAIGLTSGLAETLASLPL